MFNLCFDEISSFDTSRTMQLNQIESSKIESLFSLENELIIAAQLFGLELVRTKSERRESLGSITPRRFTEVESNLMSLLEAFKFCALEGIDPWNDREFFKICMKFLGLTAPSDSLDHITSGGLIEGYNMERLQVFRNLQFMEYTGHSLVDIMTVEWPLLFDRAQMITDQMIAYCDETLWIKNKTIPFNIPVHYMRELNSDKRRLYRIHFKTLSPLFSGPNKPFGILGTSECIPIDSGVDDNLEFI